MTDFFSQHKQHRHHDKRHMMMPSAPFSHLVISHTTLAFTIFKHPLNPESLPLHPAQTAKGGLLRGIAQRNLGIRITPQSLSDDQGPAFGFVRFPIPHINGQTTDQHFGIFPSHEVFMLANVHVHDIAKELNITREQVYAKYSQGPVAENS